MDTQELANNSELENSRNKSHTKISGFTVVYHRGFFSEVKIEYFIGKILIILILSLKTYNVCTCRGGSNEYLQCIFWIKNKKIRYASANPSFSI